MQVSIVVEKGVVGKVLAYKVFGYNNDIVMIKHHCTISKLNTID